jgi:DNA-binding beta-propeller fold protein YncE
MTSKAFVRTLLAVLAACPVLSAQGLRLPGVGLGPTPPRTAGRILVSGFGSDAVHAYRAWDGGVRGRASPVPGAQSIVLGPDGLLYVCAEEIDQVLRVDPGTLAVVGPFVADDPLTPADENGPLDGPTAAVFGPAGDLFVASFESDQILRFDGQSGVYEGVFVAANLGGLDGPDAGTKFGPDGLLYVPSFWNDRVLRYDGNGEFLDEFVAFREGNVRRPRDLVHRGGHWYVASSSNNRIVRFDAAGNFVANFATVSQPYSLAFHPVDRDLYVVSLADNGVYRLDGRTGAVLDAAVTAGSGGVVAAVYLFFLP